MGAFRFRHQLQARFRDCDLFGHVNNAVYFTYMEEAQWAYWRALTGDFSHERLPRLILARTECDFVRPVRSGERLDIWMGMRYDRGAIVASGKSAVVADDHSAAKPVPVPDWARARIEEYEGRLLSRT